jgi:hypothetical protein
MDARIRSPLIVIRRSVGSVSGRDFPSPLRRLRVRAWAFSLTSAPRIGPTRMPTLSGTTDPSGSSAYKCTDPARERRVCEVTEAFLQHYNEERPRKAPDLWQCPAACGLSDAADLTRTRHPRVDPHAWLTPLDQKMYLRHVGRDGCVDVDLATYYIGPQVAGRTVLLQIVAQSRQFAVWHQHQVVKLLPGPRSGRAGDGSGRLSEVYPARGLSCPATFFCP